MTPSETVGEMGRDELRKTILDTIQGQPMNLLAGLPEAIAAASSRGWRFIAPVTKVNRSTAVGFTTVSCAADTGDDTAKIGIFEATVDGIDATGAYTESYIEMRKTGTAVVSATPKFTSYAHGGLDHGGGNRTGHYFVPLDATEQFDYRVVFGHPSSPLAQIFLVGYIL